MTPDLSRKIQAIERWAQHELELAEAATAGPWTVIRERITKGPAKGKDKVRCITAPRPESLVFHTNWCDGDPWQVWIEGRPATFDFIASSRTAVPIMAKGLLVAIDALRQIELINPRWVLAKLTKIAALFDDAALQPYYEL